MSGETAATAEDGGLTAVLEDWPVDGGLALPVDGAAVEALPASTLRFGTPGGHVTCSACVTGKKLAISRSVTSPFLFWRSLASSVAVAVAIVLAE